MVLEVDFPPDERVEKEALSLIEGGHEIFIACYSLKQTEDLAISNYKGIHICKKRLSSFLYKSGVGALKFPFYFNFWRNFLHKVITELNPDAVHVHDLPLARIGYEIGTTYNIPFVLDLHENYPALLSVSKHTNTFLGKILSSNLQWQKYEKNYVEKADEVIVVIDEARDRLLPFRSGKSQPVVVMNTLDERIVPAIGRKDVFSPVLYYSGGVTPHRGLDIVIRAIPKVLLSFPSFEFWIVGKGNEETNLKLLAKKLSVKDHVVFHGWKNFSDMFGLMALSYAAIIPHTKNAHTDSTIPNKLFQYMYYQKPIISSNCIPIERIVHETHCGLIYRHDEPDDLADKIVRIYSNRVECRKFAENGKKAITSEYSWVNDQRRLIELYSRLKSKIKT